MHMISTPSSRDHSEVDLGPAAGVSDRGLRHHRNEDAMALAAEQSPNGPMVVAVVCDGVSSSARPDEASLAAVQAALPVLVTAVRAGEDLAEASRAAVTAARQAIAALAEPAGDTSATTFASVVASGYEVTLCWLGDSRAYWLAQAGSESRQLTQDDSVAGGMVAAGWAGTWPTTPTALRTSSGTRRPGRALCSYAPTACGITCPRRRIWPRSRCPRR
jgi:serine/threonine protein phosphatase PrpC